MTSIRALAVLAIAAPAFAQEVSVTVSPAIQEIRQGSTPRFQVVVRANEHVRMLDIGSRLDLRDRLVKPRFVQQGDLSDTPTHPHELLPVGDTDYVELEKGNSLAYETDGAPLDIAWLPAGNYVLQLRVHTDWAARFVESNKVRFKILPGAENPAAVNGVKLFRIDRGRGEPIVFVHGGIADHREWDRVAARLAANHRTIAYSRRYNFPNDNPISSQPYSPSVDAEDLAQMLAKLGIASAHIVGLSYGGLAALTLALEHPALVKTLTLVEPALMGWLDEIPGGADEGRRFNTDLIAPSAAAFAAQDSERALRVALDYFIRPGAMDRVPPAMLEIPRANLREWDAITRSSIAFPKVSRDRVAALTMPIMMISGARTYPMMKLTDAELERVLSSRVERHIVPGGSHDVCTEKPDACAELIGTFVDRLHSGPPSPAGKPAS